MILRGSHNRPERSPRRSQLDYGLRRSRHLADQEVTSSRRHRHPPLERFQRTRTESYKRKTRPIKARPILPVIARLRPVREPRRTCAIPRRQPSQGDAGTEADQLMSAKHSGRQYGYRTFCRRAGVGSRFAAMARPEASTPNVLIFRKNGLFSISGVLSPSCVVHFILSSSLFW